MFAEIFYLKSGKILKKLKLFEKFAYFDKVELTSKAVTWLGEGSCETV